MNMHIKFITYTQKCNYKGVFYKIQLGTRISCVAFKNFFHHEEIIIMSIWLSLIYLIYYVISIRILLH
jgi:hypothetical protein